MENVMITAWNWILLTDFASFKPTFLPEDNPAEFSYFFDTSRRYLFQAYSNFFCQVTFCSSTFRYFDNFSSSFLILGVFATLLRNGSKPELSQLKQLPILL